MIWFVLNSANLDTTASYNTSFWRYSSCAVTSGSEVFGFYASSSLQGAAPLLVGISSGAGGCVLHTYTAYNLTPIKELKPKVFQSSFEGGVMGLFSGLGLIILLKFLNI